jgi:predicted transcriptional regulator of viral defense system
MPRLPRLSIAKKDIVKLFRENPQKIYTTSHIAEILQQNRNFWRLTNSTTVNKFLEYLLKSTELKREQIHFPYRPVVRFTWGEVDTYALVQSINPLGYFTHYSAIYLHGLTEQLPKAIYFNQEQRASGGGGDLSQGRINNAFRGNCRITSNVATFRDRNIHLLNGQNTRQLGVIDVTINDSVKLRVTNIERTLIDATVRPVYSGGVFEVAKAFVQAYGNFSVNKLVAILKQLNFTYPYHQSIGYYMQRTNLYKKNQLDLLRQFPINFDFYLDYGLKRTDFNADWRLYTPQGF